MKFLLGLGTVVFLFIVVATYEHQQKTIASLEHAVLVSENQVDRCLSVVDEYDKLSDEMLAEIDRFVNE